MLQHCGITQCYILNHYVDFREFLSNQSFIKWYEKSRRFYFLDGIILGLPKSLQDRFPPVCFDYQFCFSRQLLLSSGTAMEYQKVPLQFLQKFDSLNPTVTYTHGRTPLVSQLKKVFHCKVSIRFQNKYRWAEKPALFIFASFNT